MAVEIRPVRHTYTGTEDEIRRLIGSALRRGELVAVEPPTPVTAGRFVIGYTLREPVEVARPAGPVAWRAGGRWSLGWWVAAAVVVLAVLGGLGWVVYSAYLWVAAHLWLTVAWACVIGVGLVLVLRAVFGGGSSGAHWCTWGSK